MFNLGFFCSTKEDFVFILSLCVLTSKNFVFCSHFSSSYLCTLYTFACLSVCVVPVIFLTMCVHFFSILQPCLDFIFASYANFDLDVNDCIPLETLVSATSTMPSSFIFLLVNVWRFFLWHVACHVCLYWSSLTLNIWYHLESIHRLIAIIVSTHVQTEYIVLSLCSNDVSQLVWFDFSTVYHVIFFWVRHYCMLQTD